jgi:hypothetical protein
MGLGFCTYGGLQQTNAVALENVGDEFSRHIQSSVIFENEIVIRLL